MHVRFIDEFTTVPMLEAAELYAKAATQPKEA